MATQFICSRCRKQSSTTTLQSQCECGGLFDLQESAAPWDESLIDRDTWNLFRYRRFLTMDDDTSWRKVSMGEGMTPVISFDSDTLFKMDYCMPTLSFKDRGAATLVAHMLSIGVHHCVQDSSGNAGNSIAAYCARAGISCEIYVPEGTSPKKIIMIEAHGAKVHIVEGTRDHCAEVCRERVQKDGIYYANHVFNPYFYEGMKAYIYETYEALHRIPRNLVIPVGNGTLFIGAVKALEHLQASGAIEQFPNIIALQSELCAPLYLAANAKSPDPVQVSPLPTIAEGIAIGKPMRGTEILDMVYRHNIHLVTAPENKILQARATIAQRGIYCEHTTAANYAAYLHYCELYGPTPDTLITMCGAGIKSDH